jgi:hypothetical protein
LVVLVALGVIGYGLVCVVRGRLDTEGVVLEGVSARLLGAAVAGAAAVTLVRSALRWRKQR